MLKSLLTWAALASLTLLNLRYFLGRWAELPHPGLGKLLSEMISSSLFVGIGIGAATLAVLDHLLGRRWIRALLTAGAVAALLLYLRQFPAFSKVFPPVEAWLIGGIALALLSLSRRENSLAPAAPGKIKVIRSLMLYSLASLNLFLIFAPYTTMTPAYMQDGNSPVPSLTFFYYGSIHSDISMVSAVMRRIINSFFDLPSINATILSSMIIVAAGLACVALAFEMLFGSIWGWMILLAAWTDRYMMAGAIASSVVSMPIFTAGSIFLLCVWSLTRRSGILSWKETWALGAFNAFELLYNLYSYSAARIPWVIGSAIAACILLLRRAVPLNFAGLMRVLVTLAPSVLVAVVLLVFVFESDVTRFKAQILISPRPEQIIKDINDYSVKVHPMHDVDMPIWWGTGRPEGINLCVYWRRTPQEIYEKAAWFMRELSFGSPVAPYLLVLAGVSLIVGAFSNLSIWRHLSIVSFISLLGAFSPFILAQDASAYRRALPTNLMVLIPIISLFAIRGRHGITKLLSVTLCIAFCVIKAPLEWSVLFTNFLHTPLCLLCQDHFNVRYLVNDPVYQQIKTRPLVFILDGKNIAGQYRKCVKMAVDSHEMKSLSPDSRYMSIEGRTLMDAFNSVSAGDILVVPCPTGAAPEGEMADICDGTPAFGTKLGSIKDPAADFNKRTKWVFLEKTN
jgi:hypothetical protein